MSKLRNAKRLGVGLNKTLYASFCVIVQKDKKLLNFIKKTTSFYTKLNFIYLDNGNDYFTISL